MLQVGMTLNIKTFGHIIEHYFLHMTEVLIGLLEHRRGQNSSYIGCMKSGDVVAEEYVLYFTFV